MSAAFSTEPDVLRQAQYERQGDRHFSSKAMSLLGAFLVEYYYGSLFGVLKNKALVKLEEFI